MKAVIPIEQKIPPGDRTAAEWNDVAKRDPPQAENPAKQDSILCDRSDIFSVFLLRPL